MNTKKAVTAGALVILAFGLISTAAAQDASDDSDVEVTVAAETAVDIDPDAITYSDLAPGDTTVQTDDDNPVEAVQIENVGSEDITDVWFEATEPQEVPFGTGDASNYDAANFLEISIDSTKYEAEGEFENLGDSITPYRDQPVFVNRRDYAETRDLSYIFVEDEADWEYGRFRVGDEEFFWAVDTTTDVSAETDGPLLRVGDTVHTQTQTGTSDFTDGGNDYTEYELQETATIEANFGKADITVGPGDTVEDRDYTVVVQTDDETAEGVYTARSKFNTQYQGEDLGDGSAELIFDSEGAQVLNPGDSFQVETGVRVPRGVPSESVSPGTLTVNVRSGGA